MIRYSNTIYFSHYFSLITGLGDDVDKASSTVSAIVFPTRAIGCAMAVMPMISAHGGSSYAIRLISSG